MAADRAPRPARRAGRGRRARACARGALRLERVGSRSGRGARRRGGGGRLDRAVRPLGSGPAAGVLYAGALVVSLGLLRASPSYGLPAILWLFAVVWGTDVAAYFAGRLIGGPRLWPSVSPGKTWSGAIAGAFAGAALGLLLAGVDEPDRPAVLARACGRGRLGTRRPVRIRRSSVGSASRIRAASFPATAASWTGSTPSSRPPPSPRSFAAANSKGSFIASGLFQW